VLTRAFSFADLDYFSRNIAIQIKRGLEIMGLPLYFSSPIKGLIIKL
jgi:hypothetical protein